MTSIAIVQSDPHTSPSFREPEALYSHPHVGRASVFFFGGTHIPRSPRRSGGRIFAFPGLFAAAQLELGGAVSVVDGVTEGGIVVVAHLGVAAQNLVLGTLCAGIATCSPCCSELVGPSGFVLICEEGLEPPINKEFRYVSSPMGVTGEGESSSLPRGTVTGRS